MFRNRPNARKPTDELYAAFKESFPSVGPSHDAANSSDETLPLSTDDMNPTLTDAALDQRPFGDHDDSKDHDMGDSWRFTPGLMDPNGFSFGSFNPQGYYTPTPEGVNTVYHNQAAGDLHTPGMAFQLGTPLSMSMADSALNANAFASQGFNPQIFQNQPFQNSNIFHQQDQQQQQQQQQQSFPPAMLVHQDSGYDPVETTPDNDMEFSGSGRENQLSSNHHDSKSTHAPLPPNGEKFRYNVTLNAPTAMTRYSDEIPITYLNKGQAYTLSIVDSTPGVRTTTPLKYRTTIRISFEDEQQRQRPASCWQLWKEGRGLSEAHQRGGKLQAVEYVDPHPGAEEDPRRPRIELDNSSFDCFTVNWSPSIATSTAECSIAVRFNFLSTDFSHSKGVKGIPVRLCAKTEIASTATIDEPTDPEVSFCKVKLFRDHGAERKLSNDVAHVKKTIDKLKQQIAQAEAGIKDFNKRKRTASLAGKTGERPSKVQKHKRTWSIGSQDGSGRPALEDDLHQKLQTVQDMFSSTRPVSVLYLRGAEQDDPDLFPVALPGDSGDATGSEIIRTGSWDQRQSEGASPSTADSPELSSRSNTGFKIPPRKSSKTTTWPMSATLPATNFAAAMEQARRVQKIKRGDGEEFDATGIDPAYVPPEQPTKPVACFYVLLKSEDSDNIYRAAYLLRRTIDDLVSAVATKSDIDPSRVQRCVRITPNGLKVLVDQEVVREIPEGQDMVIEFQDVKPDEEVEIKEETLKPITSEVGNTTPLGSTPLEMQLLF